MHHKRVAEVDVAGVCHTLSKVLALSDELLTREGIWMQPSRDTCEKLCDGADRVWREERAAGSRLDVGPADKAEQALFGRVKKMPKHPSVLVPACISKVCRRWMPSAARRAKIELQQKQRSAYKLHRRKLQAGSTVQARS